MISSGHSSHSSHIVHVEVWETEGSYDGVGVGAAVGVAEGAVLEENGVGTAAGTL